MFRDSVGRIFTYNPEFDNAIDNYTGVGATERYDPVSQTWTALASSNESVQPDLVYWDAVNNRYSRACGQNTSGPFVGSYELYDTASNTWTLGGSLPLHQERIQNVGWLEGGATPYTVGGIGSGGTNTTTGQEVYKYVGGAWVRLGDAPAVISGDQEPPVDSSGRRYFIYFDGGTHAAFRRYTPATDTWETLITFSAEVAVTPFCQVGSKVYLAAAAVGHPAAWIAYNVETDTWSRLADRVVNKTGRFVYHPGVNAIFLPGSNYTNAPTNPYSNIIYRYDIDTDVWSDTGDVVTSRDFAFDSSFVYDGYGIYLGQGQLPIHFPNELTAVNVVEYFVPVGAVAPVVTRARSYAQIIG